MPIKVKTVVQAAIVGLLLLIIWNLWSRPSSTFVLAPTDLMVRGTSGGPASIFDIKPSLACTPGPSAQADYYTSGMTPGGLCGGMNFVHAQQRDYAITDGIGGPLMAK
jgi:hypothetical protein